jgi:glycine cleavage system H protein
MKYTEDHEWLRIEDDLVVVGITEYASTQLGDVVFVELPEPGASVAAGATVSEVESTKSVSDIYAPVSGSVSAVNDSLDTQPELLNSDPYGEGWIFRIRLTDPSELEGLMDAEAYRALTEG